MEPAQPDHLSFRATLCSFSRSLRLKLSARRKTRGAAITLLASSLLISCVTTTTGGFNVSASSEQALSDYVQLATSYYEAGDMTGARRHIRNALAIDNRSSDAYHVQALVFQREGETELAREHFETALSYDRNNSQARNNFAAFLFDGGHVEEAFEQLELVTRDTAYESRPLAFQNMGLSALEIGRVDAAEHAFTRAVQLDENLYRSALELAQIKLDKGEAEDALQYYNQFVSTTGFYNIAQTPRSLWLGIRIQRKLENSQAAVYAAVLENFYRDSPEYQLYLNSINE